LHAQGGQLWPAAQLGHAQPHPLAPPSGTGFARTQAPLGQGAVMQTMPSSIQLHALAWSAPQVAASPWAAQGSAGTAAAGPTIVVVVPVGVLLTPTLPAPQAHSQGGQVAPGAQVGHAQVHVPPPVPPPHEPLLPVPLPPQSHVQGRQVSPGAQAGHAHVQVPPPPPADPFEQSHATTGQEASGGQAIGCTQVQPPPEASRA
jgi:hypothetical protein